MEFTGYFLVVRAPDTDVDWRYTFGFGSYAELTGALSGNRLVDGDQRFGGTYIDLVHGRVLEAEYQAPHPPYLIDVLERHHLAAYELGDRGLELCEPNPNQYSGDCVPFEPWSIDVLTLGDPKFTEEFGGHLLETALTFADAQSAAAELEHLRKVGFCDVWKGENEPTRIVALTCYGERWLASFLWDEKGLRDLAPAPSVPDLADLEI
jgi:hypothetical protein